MNGKLRRALLWAPRFVTMAFTLFISLFALDVFEPGKGFGETVLDLLRHLIPAFLLLLILALAWRWEWIGALGAVVLAALFLWWNFTVRHNTILAVAMIAGPLFLIAALYLYGWLHRQELRRTPR